MTSETSECMSEDMEGEVMEEEIIVRRKRELIEPDVDFWFEFWDLLSMAWQVSLATVTRVALTSIDAAFLGHVGTQYLAAASLAATWTQVVQLAVWGGTSALITLCGQAWGAGNKELCGIWLQIGILITGCASTIVFIWYWCVGFVLYYSTPDVEVVEAGIVFSRILSFSAFPALMYACMRQYFQAMGVMWPTTVCGLVALFLTVVLNYVFIYGICGWKGFGFAGSPLSTVVARYGWNFQAITKERLKQYIAIAGPISANSFVSTLANSALTLLAARLGSDVIAANAVLGGLWSVLWALFWGFGCSTQVKVANYMGAGRPKAAKQLAVIGALCSCVVVIVLMLLIMILKRRVFLIYTNDEHIVDLCMGVLWMYCGALSLTLIEMLMAAVLSGMGKVRTVFLICASATWCIELPVAYVAGLVFHQGLGAIWISVLCMEVFKFASYAITHSFVSWDDRALMAMAQMAVKGDDHASVDDDEEKPLLAYSVYSNNGRILRSRNSSNSDNIASSSLSEVHICGQL
eukprot:CFRG6530T1